jgi:hypothetical protein
MEGWLEKLRSATSPDVKMIERIAGELNQLSFLLGKGGRDLAMVQQSQPVIQSSDKQLFTRIL